MVLRKSAARAALVALVAGSALSSSPASACNFLQTLFGSCSNQPVAAAPGAAGLPPEDPEVLPPGGGGVVVQVDQITRPGAIISGKVAFSDGQTADWYIDQTGRLGLIAKQPGYKPTQADAQEFQLALQREVARLGY